MVIAMLKHGTLRENKIHFNDIEKQLSRLITQFGGRPTGDGPKPWRGTRGKSEVPREEDSVRSGTLWERSGP